MNDKISPKIIFYQKETFCKAVNVMAVKNLCIIKRFHGDTKISTHSIFEKLLD